ncbi:MAG TPA: protein-glutamate O-methyltransferase CheR [Kofleriaceae bacterium]|nr:protein-glutamate O-methyltransferase CheR [Kofleriaceae bacterium]
MSPSVPPEALHRFARAIEARFGMRVHDRPAAMAEVLARRADGHRETIDAYLRRLDTGAADELRALAAEVSVGETYFFRHVEQCHAFADLLPELVAAYGAPRVLSAGCSTGEEPYTLAMIAHERLAAARAVAICGIDVNPLALARARAGRYSRWALRATPIASEQRWFAPDGRDRVLAPELRRAVTFEEANLFDDAPWASQPWHVVFCRNVLMYFADDRGRALVDRLVGALAPGGYLFLGHAEALRDRPGDLELCHSHGTFYYRRGGGPRPARERPAGVGFPQLPPAHDDRWFGEIAAATGRVNAMVASALAAAPPPPDRLEPIRALVRAERFADALAALAALPAELARCGDALLLRAVVATQIDTPAAAAAMCNELLATGAHAASAHYLIAICRDNAGDAAGSAHHAERALACDPTFAMASVQLGFLARRRGERAAAAQHLARAIDLLDRDDEARIALVAGGFGRAALLELCRSELARLGGRR